MISREVYVFLAMIICGGALAVVFDMLRAMRMVLNPFTKQQKVENSA